MKNYEHVEKNEKDSTEVSIQTTVESQKNDVETVSIPKFLYDLYNTLYTLDEELNDDYIEYNSEETLEEAIEQLEHERLLVIKKIRRFRSALCDKMLFNNA